MSVFHTQFIGYEGICLHPLTELVGLTTHQHRHVKGFGHQSYLWCPHPRHDVTICQERMSTKKDLRHLTKEHCFNGDISSTLFMLCWLCDYLWKDVRNSWDKNIGAADASLNQAPQGLPAFQPRSAIHHYDTKLPVFVKGLTQDVVD